MKKTSVIERKEYKRIQFEFQMCLNFEPSLQQQQQQEIKYFPTRWSQLYKCNDATRKFEPSLLSAQTNEA